jgi:hypothetical protein
MEFHEVCSLFHVMTDEEIPRRLHEAWSSVVYKLGC